MAAPELSLLLRVFQVQQFENGQFFGCLDAPLQHSVTVCALVILPISRINRQGLVGVVADSKYS